MKLYQDVVLDRNGNVVANATVAVKNEADDTAATVYPANTPTGGVSSVTTDSDGRFEFYAKNGTYYTVTSKSGITTHTGDPFTIEETSGVVNVLGFGAVADGVTDDTEAFTDALAAGNTVIVPPGDYAIGDVDIPIGKAIVAHGAYFYGVVGSDYVFSLTGASSRLIGAYISDASECSEAAVVVDMGRGVLIDGLRIINAVNGIVLKASTAATGCARTQISNLQITTFTGVGIDMQADVSETFINQAIIDATAIDGSGGLIPRTGAIGFRHTGTSSVVAFGGHRIANVTIVNCETGWKFINSTLSTLIGCVADGISGIGLSIEQASNFLDFEGFFAGSCGRGIQISQTSNDITFTGLRTILQGTIPSWGGTDFYSSGSMSAPFYDVALLNTATATIDGNNWWGDKTLSEASAGNLTVTGGLLVPWETTATLAAGSTNYVGINGHNATESFVQIIAPFAGTMWTIYAVHGAAPGTSETFTYTVRQNGVDSALTAQSTGTGVFVATNTGSQINVSKGQGITLKIVTSASAAVTTHRGFLQMIPRGN